MADFDIERIVTLLQTGHADLAEQECRRLLMAEPDHELLLTMLGMALQQKGKADQAGHIYERLTWLYPGVSEHWSNLATVLREAGKMPDAERAYLVALKLAPDNVITLGNIGLLYKELADYVKARDYLLKALRGRPDDVQMRLYAAMACFECADSKQVDSLIADWHQWPPLDDELRLDLAWLLAQMGRIDEAERLLNESLDTEGKQIRARVRMILLLERVNRLDEARAILSTLPDPLSISDKSERNEVIGAMGAMAQRGPDPAITRQLLEQLLALAPESREQSNLYFALAKACDKDGDTQAALAALALAHTLQMKGAAQLVPELLLPEVQPLAPSLIRMTTKQAAGWQFPVRLDAQPMSPIFVVGFPRSGTTMLEQMLDAHPSLASMDEQPFMQNLAEQVIDRGLLYPEALGDLDVAGCESLVRAYWEQVNSVAKLKPGQRLVDKNPLNLLHIPLICRLFPDSPIILALRHPCDVILSCYMQNFRAPGFQVLCSSLDRLARGYVNGMNYWIYHTELLKPRVLNLRYEDLLDDFDAEAERIGRFIEIEDVTPLKSFHQHAQRKGFISTPSYSQVTQPPNKSAVDRWRRYENAFTPILPLLKKTMEHWGYESRANA
ncbi:tetratricopeptide repeat-containing sulfotransferase family protein [Rhodanobacter sp. BL-MT-08]